MLARRSRPAVLRRSPALAALIGIAAGLLLLAAGELALRALGLPAARPILVDGDQAVRAGVLAPDPERGYRLVPGYRASPEHAGSYALGSWPWRGRPASPAPPEVRRVVVVGDSCVYGIGLEVADTLPERLAHALDERGFPPTDVQVLNLGVPGYSSLQIERVLAQALAEHQPDAVVLYPAAWNDQAPALAAPDAAVLSAAGAGWFERTALGHALAAAASSAAPSADAVVRAWEAGDAPFGTRVPAEDVQPAVERMIAAARDAGAAAVVLAPAHPRATAERYARVAADREAVRRAARAAGTTLVDVEDLARASGLPDHALFVDFVHPSPALWELAAPSVADAVARALGPPPPPPTTTVDAWAPRATPAELSALGDARIAIELAGWGGWAPGEPAPVATVGGAPLLEPALEGTMLSGQVPKNAAGAHDLVVFSARAAVRTRAAVRLVAARLELVPDGSALVLVARPGDRASVVLARGLAAEPRHDLRGAYRLDPADTLAKTFELTAGAEGTARLGIPADALQGAGELHAQALVLPRGEPPESREARWTAALRLSRPR
jgi:lysophospholipase L1-like esterase